MDSMNEDGEFREDLNNIVVCPDCREYPPNLVEEFSSGDMVCESCGLVVGDRIIDTRSEWRTFADSEQGDDPSRVGDAVNPLLEGSQLETSIGFSESRQGRNLARMQNQGNQDKTSRVLLQAYKEIGVLIDTLSLGSVVSDSAKHLFKLLEEGKFTKGKSQDVVISTCVFIAARKENAARTFREVCAVSGNDKKDIGRMFKLIESYLKRITKGPKGKAGVGLLEVKEWKNTATIGADALVGRFCTQLPFRQVQKMENLARELAHRAATLSELAGRSPLSLAAACIFMASYLLGDPKSSKDIAGVASVSDGTVRTAYKHLYQAKDVLIDKNLLQKHRAKVENLVAI